MIVYFSNITSLGNWVKKINIKKIIFQEKLNSITIQETKMKMALKGICHH